jgi:hypothetical protein
MFVAEKYGLYQILNEYSTYEEIMESNEEISNILKSLNFKRLTLKGKYTHIGIIQTCFQKQIKVNDIKTCNHLVALHPEKIIFNLNSDKLRVLALLRLSL